MIATPSNFKPKITTTIYFEAAHRLIWHRGKCHNLHGHQWKVEITIQGIPDSRTGMIVDFSEIKSYVRDVFDHSVILNHNDILYRVLTDYDQKVVVIDGEPTCENIAREIKRMIEDRFNVEVVSVKVWENGDNHAEV